MYPAVRLRLPETRAFAGTLEHGKLVMQCEVLGHKVSMRSEEKEYEATDQLEHECKLQTFTLLVNNWKSLYSKE